MGRRVRRIGESIIEDNDLFPAVLRQLGNAADVAAGAGARLARREAREIFDTRGDGMWPSNTPQTKDWKGHDKVMLGLTASLSRDIRITKPAEGVRNVGWTEDPHPDTQGRFSLGGLGALHEFGNRDLPSRPWLSQVADNPIRAQEVLQAMGKAYAASAAKRLPGGMEAIGTEGDFDG